VSGRFLVLVLALAAAACSDGSGAPGDLGAPGDFSGAERGHAATHLAFVVGPHSAATDAPIGPISLAALDEQGEVDGDFAGTVRVMISANAGALTLQGDFMRDAQAGLVGFDDLSIDGAGSGLGLSANSPGIGSASSGAFDIAAPSWSRQNSGLDGGTVLRLLVDPVDPATLYRATPGAGVFRSTDGGAGWQSDNVALADRRLRELAMNGSGTLYAASESGLFQLLRGSPAWNPIDLGGGFRALPVTAVATRGATVYAACAGRLLSSSDAGHTWSVAPANPDTAAATRLAIAPDDDQVLFASDGATVVKSSDGASHFARWMTGLPTAALRDLSFDAAGALYAATALGALQLPPGGTTWSPLSSGPCTAVVASPSEIYLAGENTGLVRLAAGVSTTLAAPPHPEPTALALAPTVPPTIYMGTHGGGPFRLDGAAWSFRGAGLAAAELTALTADAAGTLLAATRGGLFRSTDHAATWSAVSAGADPRFDALALSGGSAFALAQGHGWSSDDGGATWGADADFDGCASLLFDSTDAYCTPFDAAVIGVYHVMSGSRMLLAGGLPAHVSALATDGASLWAATASGLYRSTDSSASWTATPLGAPILAVTATSARVLATTGDGAFTSTDGGASWSALDPALNGAGWLAPGFYASADRLRHSDDGVTWTLANSGLEQDQVTALAVDSTAIYAATRGAGVFRSNQK
jgi:photosystem II stability/assembly factor-like uncharacterized protein